MVIKRETHLMGVRWWAQWLPFVVPAYQVFEYVGHQRETGLYWFRHRGSKTFIQRSFHQLNTHGFRPFVLDIKRANEWLMKHEKETP